MAKIITFGKPFISKKGNKVRYIYENNKRIGVQLWTGVNMKAWRKAKKQYNNKKYLKAYNKGYYHGQAMGADYAYNDAKGLR